MNSDDLRKLIQQKMAANPSLRSIMKRIQSGNATFRDTADYSRIYSELLGKCLSENVLDLTDREAAAADILRDSFNHTNSILSQVQTNIDKKNGINIRPQTADFPLERVQQFTHSLIDPTVEDSVIQRRARSGSANISMSHHDDYMEANARFRSKAGLKCYIDRQTDGKCCKWCTAIAGRYVYGEEPHDVYRRHDNCGCSVIYENGRQRQDVWSKRTWEEPKKIGYKKPTVISPEQARALEQGKLRNIHGLSIDNERGSGIIGSELESLIRYSDNREVSQNIRASLENTISVIPEHLKNRLEQYVPEIIIEENRGYSSFSPDTHRIILDMKNADRDILHELGHAFASMDNLYEDEEFLAVLSDGLNNENWNNVVPLKHPYRDETVYIHISDKFVDPYQGRIYADIFSVDYSEPIDLHFFKEYISVGFDTYFSNPELLKAKDIKLFNYLEGKING